MSLETSHWLNNNVLVGMTDKRGNAWHYRKEHQGAESNHYPLAIPVADVERRLFHWTAEERPLLVAVPSDLDNMTGFDAAGNPIRHMVLDDRKAIVTSDTNEVLGVFKSGYQPHQYREWLIHNIANILDDNLAISSAGLLKNRAVAWVEVSVPENIKTPEGVEFRPNLLACTSFDGSLATTYKRTVQLTVCDNTMAVALSESGQQLKVKHSKYSQARLADAREALAIVFDTADAFSAEIARLTRIDVTDRDFNKVLDVIIPAEGAEGAKLTRAQNKRDDLHTLYNFDRRVSDWKGTAFGVVQAFNTYNHHKLGVKDMGGTGRSENALRAERNMLNAIDGSTDKSDGLVLDAINKVLSLA